MWLWLRQQSCKWKLARTRVGNGRTGGMRILDRDDLRESAVLFAAACACSRAHVALADDACRRYGDHGALISGCVRDHFPDAVKDNLRALAQSVTRWSDCAWSARPPRVRRGTMRALSRAVCRRDGGGFYGPTR
jgi:hypothetical protein